MHSECYSSLLAIFLSVCVCLVCLSVTTLAKALLGSMPRKRYIQHWYMLFSVLSSSIFEKTFHSRREKANMLMSICLLRHHMAPIQRYFARFSKTEPSLILLKSNGRLQVRQRATSHSDLRLLIYGLPYTFRYIFINACTFSKPRARATAFSAEGRRHGQKGWGYPPPPPKPNTVICTSCLLVILRPWNTYLRRSTYQLFKRYMSDMTKKTSLCQCGCQLTMVRGCATKP